MKFSNFELLLNNLLMNLMKMENEYCSRLTKATKERMLLLI